MQKAEMRSKVLRNFLLSFPPSNFPPGLPLAMPSRGHQVKEPWQCSSLGSKEAQRKGWDGSEAQALLLSWFTDQEDEDQDQDQDQEVSCPSHNKLQPSLSGTITSLGGRAKTCLDVGLKEDCRLWEIRVQGPR